jgi:hypothetical protein
VPRIVLLARAAAPREERSSTVGAATADPTSAAAMARTTFEEGGMLCEGLGLVVEVTQIKWLATMVKFSRELSPVLRRERYATIFVIKWQGVFLIKRSSAVPI